MSKLKPVLLVALAGLILAGCSYQSQPTSTTKVNPTSTALPTPPTIAANTIAYTDTGFSPKTITVKPGTTVTFVNQSSEKMWVASAVHPTHLELPGFDQLKGEGKGATYSFTFKDVGTWRFHDHLNPQATGSVVVAE